MFAVLSLAPSIIAVTGEPLTGAALAMWLFGQIALAALVYFFILAALSFLFWQAGFRTLFGFLRLKQKPATKSPHMPEGWFGKKLEKRNRKGDKGR